MNKQFNAIIIHYDEIGLKGKNQKFFIGRLIGNIQKLYAKVDSAKNIQVKKGEGKIIISGNIGKDDFDKMALLPGISNFAPAIVCGTDLEAIKQAANQIVQTYQPKTFKIETTRSYKQFELDSQELSREVGGYVLAGSRDLNVDLHKPELTVKIELAKIQTCVLGKKEQGIGGLPVGTAGKVICLLSGGIDSPVAASQIMKRGAQVVFAHFHNQTINKKGVENKIKNIVRRLAQIQGESTLYIIPFADLQKQVIAGIPADLRMIVYRRLMFRIAERLAVNEKARALVTGDSLSQVASQTLENLEVIYSASNMLKLAPLIGMNKIEITNLAKKIGTYDVSVEPYEDCCSLLIAKHPETRARLEDVLKAEGNLDVEGLIKEAVINSQLSIEFPM